MLPHLDSDRLPRMLALRLLLLQIVASGEKKDATRALN
jgi:hypothetical protein